MSRLDQKRQTRQRILEGAGRGFRKGGYGGVGVDGLAKEAGVTSGAFYAHFPSKAHAFREAIVLGMKRLKDGICQFQEEYGDDWWTRFVHFYLNERRADDLSESCVLPALSEEVVRSEHLSRRAFEKGLREAAAAIVVGPESLNVPRDTESAYAALATLLGGVTLARAVKDPVLAQTIATSVERTLLPQPASSQELI
jgi:TetR/AcrR family transcriptional repressor of nem operon